MNTTPSQAVLNMAGPALIAAVTFVAVLFVAKYFGRRYQEKYSAEKGMAWWYWVGIMCALNPVLWLPGVLILAKKSRWAWLTVTLFSFNPLMWIVNSIYAARRWKMLEQNHGRDRLGMTMFFGYLALFIAILSLAIRDYLSEATSPKSVISSLATIRADSSRSSTAEITEETGRPAITPETTSSQAPQRVFRTLYSITPLFIDATRISPQSPDQDLAYKISNTAFFFVVSEEQMMEGSPLMDHVSQNWKTGIPDVKIVHADKATLGSNSWAHIVAEGTSEGIYVTIDAYLYTGEEGTFQLTGIYPTNRKDYYSQQIQATVTTFRFTRSSDLDSGTASTSAASGNPRQ